MKLLWHVFVGFVLINLLLAAGFVGWLYADGRINKERVDRVVEMFSLTVDQEQALAAEAQLAEEEAQRALQQNARLESTGNGPKTLSDQLQERTEATDVRLAKIQMLNDQNRALRDEMTRFKEDHTRRVEELERERADFEQWIKDQAEKTQDENFQQVVSLYQTFQTLMQQGETDQVVEYLAAMSSRKAGAVLAQFKAPNEVPQAALLLEKLRLRGDYNADIEPPQPGNQS
jgi:flagellar motility protein MotE (MotC chaperone)